MPTACAGGGWNPSKVQQGTSKYKTHISVYYIILQPNVEDYTQRLRECVYTAISM